MKQYGYKGVVIRPRLEVLEDWLEKHIKESWGWYSRPDETFKQYREKRLSEGGWERLYWDTRSGSKWFVFFPNGRIVKMPYKKCTETWADFEARVDKVIARVEKESKGRYAEFSNLMQRIVNERIKDCSYLTYPTTYGFGLEAIFNWNFDKQAAEIEKLLNEMGVSYTTEYSDAFWVFRYRISKAADNQKLIQSLLKSNN